MTHEPIEIERRQFASDNYAGICPAAWQAMAAANVSHAPGYGDDKWTQQVSDRLRDLFEIDCEVFFTFNGTAANSLALASICRSYHGVIAHEHAHVETDECGGPEFFGHGTKLLLVRGKDGKVTSDEVERIARRRADVHFPKPRVLSITQSTEMGTVYSVADLQSICDTAKRCGLYVHMDGARFANAVAALDQPPREVTWKAGVDVLCFGGTKNGLAVGECLIFFQAELADEFAYRCKQAGQLASKMRFLSAPWLGLLEGDVWLENAGHANKMATKLAGVLQELPGVEILYPVQANAIFVRFPPQLASQLRQDGWHFYEFPAAGGYRLMCSWDTTEQDVDHFVADISRLQH